MVVLGSVLLVKLTLVMIMFSVAVNFDVLEDDEEISLIVEVLVLVDAVVIEHCIVGFATPAE